MAAGPGLPLEPPSEKILKCLGINVHSFFVFS
jgi:hypothetical protein